MQSLKRACQIAKTIMEKRTGRPIDGDGQTALATLLGKGQGHVGMWLSGRRKIPAEDCVDIERVLDGEVTRAQLRPDLFGELPAAKKKKAA
ncbi:MAG: helix-turn-helix domain-containing protein [Reyranella sp.]|nr:helix-turn-helix domain-containing protein [Reyranella sp.]